MNKAQQLITLAVDPAYILRVRGIEPDPWQQVLLQSSERHILLNCSRQTGKSTTVAALSLHTALVKPQSLILLLSPSQRQSSELFRKVMDCYRAVDRALDLEATGQANQTQLELTNGSRIVSLPGNEETIRSFSGVALLVIDEAARVEDDLYRSVRPMLAVSQGRLICLSTPFGKRGFFWSEWEDKEGPWLRVRITWRECPRIQPEIIEQEKRSLGESWVRQEYECSFEALEGLVYPDFEQRCGVADGVAQAGKPVLPAQVAQAFQPVLPERQPEQPAVGGLDFGFRNPFAAVWGHVDRDGVLWITGEHYERERTIPEHAERLPKGVMWYADPSGAQEIRMLLQLGVKVRRGQNDIRAGIAAVHARLQTGRLRVSKSACPNLLSEAKLYRYPPNNGDTTDSETPLDAHNHALAALRYLVSALDRDFLRRYRREEIAGKPAPEKRPPSLYQNEDVWTRIL